MPVAQHELLSKQSLTPVRFIFRWSRRDSNHSIYIPMGTSLWLWSFQALVILHVGGAAWNRTKLVSDKSFTGSPVSIAVYNPKLVLLKGVEPLRV